MKIIRKSLSNILLFVIIFANCFFTGNFTLYAETSISKSSYNQAIEENPVIAPTSAALTTTSNPGLPDNMSFNKVDISFGDVLNSKIDINAESEMVFFDAKANSLKSYNSQNHSFKTIIEQKITDFACDNSNGLIYYIGSSGDNENYYGVIDQITYEKTEFTADRYYSKCLVDAKGNAWIIGSYTLSKITTDGLQSYPFSNLGIGKGPICSFISDQKGNIWIGTYSINDFGAELIKFSIDERGNIYSYSLINLIDPPAPSSQNITTSYFKPSFADDRIWVNAGYCGGKSNIIVYDTTGGISDVFDFEYAVECTGDSSGRIWSYDYYNNNVIAYDLQSGRIKNYNNSNITTPTRISNMIYNQKTDSVWYIDYSSYALWESKAAPISPTPTVSNKLCGYINTDFSYLQEATSQIKTGFEIKLICFIDGGSIYVLNTSSNDEGYFDFELSSVPHYCLACDLVIKKENYICKKMAFYPSDLSSTVKIEMWAGDLNGDNVINIVDVMGVAKSFGKIKGKIGYNENADINLDGVVDITDVMILAKHFNAVGSSDPVVPFSPTPSRSV